MIIKSDLEEVDFIGAEFVCQWWQEAIELNDWKPVCLKLRGASVFSYDGQMKSDLVCLLNIARSHLISSRV